MRVLKSANPDGLRDRIVRTVEIDGDGHWIWGGSTENGRPRLEWGGKRRSVSTVAWIAANGGLDTRFQVQMHCGHPLCVNPEHALLAKPKKKKKPKKRRRQPSGVARAGNRRGRKVPPGPRVELDCRLQAAAARNAKKDGRESFTRKDLYKAYLRSPEWKSIRAARLSETSGLCAFCGEKAKTAHHIRYPQRLGTEKPHDLVPVCDQHHAVLHGKASASGRSGGSCAFCGAEACETHRIKHRQKISDEEPCESAPVCRLCVRLADGDISGSPYYREPAGPPDPPAEHGAPRHGKVSRKQRRRKEKEVRKTAAQAKAEQKTAARLLAASQRRRASEAAEKESRAEARRLG